jgi:hypothetical protein
MRFLDKLRERLQWSAAAAAARRNRETAATSVIDMQDRRTTRRVSVRLPVFIYGRTPEGDPFYEETQTILVNGYGGLISLSAPVRPGQQLVMTNHGNDYTEQCVVVSVEVLADDRRKIALKFPRPAPQFWRGLEIGKARGR